jgi:hypothetical protein
MAAIAKLNSDDAYLFPVRLSEWTVAFRLGVYLNALFEGWNVDAEYNRKGKNAKRRASGKRFRPDIIFHTRGEEEPNLIAFELKDTRNRKTCPAKINRS